MNVDTFRPITDLFPLIAIIIVAVGGWVFTTWLRIKHGYPARNQLGPTVPPKTPTEGIDGADQAADRRNAQLRAELGSVKDRLETIERIVTDQPRRLAKEIDSFGDRQRRSRVMGPGEVFIALIVIGLPTMALTESSAAGSSSKRESFELEANLAAEKAAQYAATNAELEGARQCSRTDRDRRRTWKPRPRSRLCGHRA